MLEEVTPMVLVRNPATESYRCHLRFGGGIPLPWPL